MKILKLLFIFAVACAETWAQSYSLSPQGWAQYFDANGNPVAGGQLFTYQAGTSTPQATYSNSAGTPNANPVILDAGGFASVWLDVSKSYRFVLEDANGVVIKTQDNISLGLTTTNSLTYLAPYSNSVGRTVTSKLADVVSVLDFGADKSGIADSTAAFQNAVNTAHPAYVPCGSYKLAGTVNLTLPGEGLIGENSQCVTLNYTGAQWPIQWRMSPFTTTPAGEISNLTIVGTSLAETGILTGHLVGGTFRNLNIGGFTATTGLGAAGIEVYNQGTPTDGWFERNVFSNVQLGATAKNTHGIFFKADDFNASFGYNRFYFLGLNVSTGQTGIELNTGFLYHSTFNIVCNSDNNAVGTTGPICINISNNWSDNDLYLSGEYQNIGGGSGTPYSVQINNVAHSKFTGTGYQTVYNTVSGAPILVNNLLSPSSVPNARLASNLASTWDSGTYNMGGGLNGTTQVAYSSASGLSNLGVIQGNNIESPVVTMFNSANNRFIVGGINAASAINTMTEDFSVDNNGTGAHRGALGVGTDAATAAAQNWKLVVHNNAMVQGTTFNSAAPLNTSQFNPVLNLGYSAAAHSAGSQSLFMDALDGGGSPQLNETIGLGDNNWQAGVGVSLGTNVAHPVLWGYDVDSTIVGFYKKGFQTAISSGTLMSSIDIGGFYHGGLKPPTFTQATLPGTATPQVVYCSDCTVNAASCPSGGSGAWAFWSAGGFKCPF
jgi:hypothetical protein